MIEIIDYKKKEEYIFNGILIVIISMFLWDKLGNKFSLGEFIGIGIIMIPISIEIIIISENLREKIFGGAIKIKNIELKIKEIKYDCRVEELIELTDDEIKLSFEDIEYFLKTEYRYDRYGKGILVGATTVSGVIILLGNIINSFEALKRIVEEVGNNFEGTILIILGIIIFSILLSKDRQNLKIEKCKKINRALFKLQNDLKYYSKIVNRNFEEYNYFL